MTTWPLAFPQGLQIIFYSSHLGCELIHSFLLDLKCQAAMLFASLYILVHMDTVQKNYWLADS